MLESLDFHYDGISSQDMGLLNVKMDSGLFEEIFLHSRKINSFKVKGNDVSFFQGIERDNLSLPLTFFLPDEYEDDQLREIKRWLNQDYYKPFYFDDYPDRLFYVMYEGDSKLYHNGANQGYFTITLNSNSPYSYTPFQSETVTINDDVNGVDYQIINNGDLPCLPEIWISNIQSGSNTVKINNSANGIQFKMDNIALNETIYIDNEKKDIVSSIPNTYHINDFNGQYLQLERGVNRLKLYGKCQIQFRYQFIFD